MDQPRDLFAGRQQYFTPTGLIVLIISVTTQAFNDRLKRLARALLGDLGRDGGV